jgi:hypothetical protein
MKRSNNVGMRRGRAWKNAYKKKLKKVLAIRKRFRKNRGIMTENKSAVTGEGTLPRVIATGDRVRLTVDVDRYPHFLAKKGLTGIVLDTNASDWPKSIAVKMDEPLEGCEEWDNTILWSDEEREYFPQQVERI